MATRRYFPQLKPLTIGLIVTTLMIFSLPAQSQVSWRKGIQVSIKFPPTEDRGAPARTVGAGSRGNDACTNTNTATGNIGNDLTAIIPENNIETTVAPNPTVYVYVPQTMERKAEFSLVERESEKPVYQKTFSLVNHAGIVKIDLPKSVSLLPGNTYEWEFVIVCDQENREEDQSVDGWIERTSLTSEQANKLKKAKLNLLKQAQLYAEFGVWNESVNILTYLRDIRPQANAEWKELLKSVNLDDNIVDAPILNSPPEKTSQSGS